MTAQLVQLTRRMSKLHASPYFELSMQLMVGIELPMLPMAAQCGVMGLYICSRVRIALAKNAGCLQNG